MACFAPAWRVAKLAWLFSRARSLCLAAGVNISGVNAEVLPSQWEYQVRGGPGRALMFSLHGA
jgi:hypothetical protein